MTPSYPYFYPDNIECEWNFLTIDTDGSFAIHFREFHTQQEHDPLTIGKGNVASFDHAIYQFTGVVPSHVVLVIEEPSLWMTFYSDIIGGFTGFDLMIERIPYSGKKIKRCILLFLSSARDM